jgi:hypothetical protein
MWRGVFKIENGFPSSLPLMWYFFISLKPQGQILCGNCILTAPAETQDSTGSLASLYYYYTQNQEFVCKTCKEERNTQVRLFFSGILLLGLRVPCLRVLTKVSKDMKLACVLVLSKIR